MRTELNLSLNSTAGPSAVRDQPSGPHTVNLPSAARLDTKAWLSGISAAGLVSGPPWLTEALPLADVPGAPVGAGLDVCPHATDKVSNPAPPSMRTAIRRLMVVHSREGTDSITLEDGQRKAKTATGPASGTIAACAAA